MNNWLLLARLLSQHRAGDEDDDLIHHILRNYGLYSLTGHSHIGLALFLLRSVSDVMRLLGKGTHNDRT